MEERERDFLATIAYVYLRHGDAENAAAVLEAVSEARPHDQDIARMLAYAYLQLRQFRNCLELTDFLLGGNGVNESTLVWLLRSRALYGMGRRQEAMELWRQTRQRDE